MDQSKVAGVARRVRTMIHAGVLGEGAGLPSTRALAAELGVARGTVVAAYEQLDGEGYIRTRAGAVARVIATIDPAEVSAPAAEERSGREHTPDLPPIIDATPGVPAVTSISARDWRAAWRAAADLPLRNDSSPDAGTPALREQIAAQLGLSRGFTPDADRVIVTAGTSDAISLVTEVLRTRLRRAPRIAVEDPGYPGGRDAIVSAGGEIIAVALDDDGIDLAALSTAGAADAVMLTPTHQYPLGSVMPVARRLDLLAWASGVGAVVIEDDYDSEFRHRGSPVPALASLDTAGVVVHLGGFSKTLDPRLRCAYIVVPAAPVADAIRAARTARGPAVAEPVQAALAHLLRTGALRRHLGRVRRDYSHKRELIVQRLAAASVPALEAHGLNGGLHVVLTWSAATAAAADVVARLAGHGIRVADLSDYAASPRTAAALNGVVIGYGAVTTTELDRVLAAVLGELA